jgi:hypothetical protein
VFVDFLRIVGWNDQYSAAHIRQCIRYNSTTGEFTIRDPGFYNIYSHLAFSKSSTSNIYGQKIKIRNSVILSDSGIGSDVDRTGCGNGAGSAYNSVVQGIIQLKANDLLTLEALPLDSLCNRNSASYFGLFKLDDLLK